MPVFGPSSTRHIDPKRQVWTRKRPGQKSGSDYPCPRAQPRCYDDEARPRRRAPSFREEGYSSDEDDVPCREDGRRMLSRHDEPRRSRHDDEPRRSQHPQREPSILTPDAVQRRSTLGPNQREEPRRSRHEEPMRNHHDAPRSHHPSQHREPSILTPSAIEARIGRAPSFREDFRGHPMRAPSLREQPCRREYDAEPAEYEEIRRADEVTIGGSSIRNVKVPSYASPRNSQRR